MAQEEQIAQAAHLLAGPVGLGVSRAQACVDHAMPGRHQARFLAGLLFQHHLAEALAVIQLHREQHILQDVQQVGALRHRSLAAQEQPRRRRIIRAVLHRGGERRGADAAGLAPDAL